MKEQKDLKEAFSRAMQSALQELPPEERQRLLRLVILKDPEDQCKELSRAIQKLPKEKQTEILRHLVPDTRKDKVADMFAALKNLPEEDLRDLTKIALGKKAERTPKKVARP